MAHSPPDCSKPQPIAHRVCPHLTRAGQGVRFQRGERAQPCSARPTTTPGVRVTVRRLEKGSQTGRTAAADCKHNMNMVFDDHRPQWTSRAVPEVTGNRELIFDHILNVLTKIGHEDSWAAIRVWLFLPSEVTVMPFASMYIIEEHH